MVDLDWFKRVNDLFRHERGDEVLKLVSQTLMKSAREDDVVCRVGGDEFWIICPGSEIGAAKIFAARLCRSIDKLKISAGDKQCTVSIGISQRTPAMKTFTEMVDAADRSLYDAKRSGKSRIV